MTVRVRFRDAFRKYIPKWLSDRPGQAAGKTVGFRFLWSMIAPLDAAADILVQGLQAPWPGKGTPTALPMIGRSRSLIRSQSETDDEYAAWLRSWLELHKRQGSSESIAMSLHHYLGNRPRVRVVNRAGYWVTVDELGVLTTQQGTWDWDSVSHPERNDPDAPWWSDQWVIIYPTQWAKTSTFGSGVKFGGSGFGLGHQCSRQEYDAVNGLFAQWKSAHSCIRAAIWTSDTALFDPNDPGSLPDGTWGAWGGVGDGSRTPSGRILTTCRYWEP